MAFGVDDILVGVAGNATYDFIKLIAKTLIGYEQDDLINRIENACDVAEKEFYREFDGQYGTSKNSFLVRKVTREKIIMSVFYSSKVLTLLDIDPSGFDGANPANEEVLARFITVFETVMHQDFILDKILTEKSKLEADGKFQACILAVTSQLQDQNACILNKQEDVIQQLNQINTKLSGHSVSLSELSAQVLEGEYKSNLDYAKNELLEKGKYNEAINYLHYLKDRAWEKLQPLAKYYLLTYIASAKLALSEEEEAGKFLLQALQYNSEDENALCNAAAGAVILGSPDQAIEFARRVLKKNPVNTNAFSTLIQCSKSDVELDAILSEIPVTLLPAADVAFAIAIYYRRQGILDKAETWFRTALENDKSNRLEIKVSLAAMMIDRMTKDTWRIITDQLDAEQREQIYKAIGLIAQAWDEVKGTELEKSRGGWLYNRSIGYFTVGDIQNAVSDSELALSMEPDNWDFIKLRAQLAINQDDYAKAVELLKPISKKPEELLLLAEVMRADRQFKEAAEMVQSISDIGDQIIKVAINRLNVKLMIDTQNYSDAKRIMLKALEECPDNISYLVDLSAIERIVDSDSIASETLQKAVDSVSDNTTKMELQTLADELYRDSKYTQAAPIYEKLSEHGTSVALLDRLLLSHYQSGQLNEALETAKKMDAAYGSLRRHSEIQSVIFEYIGDLNLVKATCQRYLAKYPDDIEMRLRLALINVRLFEYGEVDAYLDAGINVDRLSIKDATILSELLSVRGRYKEAIMLLYQIRKKFFSEGEAHALYVSRFFLNTNGKEDWLNPSEVMVDTSVHLTDECGAGEWYIIEDCSNPDFQKKELNLEHPLTQKILNRTIGSRIEINRTPISVEYGMIKAIKSKYVHAAHESQNLLETIFAGHPGIYGVKIRVPRGDANAMPEEHRRHDNSPRLPDVKELVTSVVDKKSSFTDGLRQLYGSGEITLGTIACSIQENVIDVWAGLARNSEIGINTFGGNENEINLALIKLKQRPKLVLDITALLTIHTLGIGASVVLAFGNPVVVQTTIDTISQKIQQFKASEFRGGFMTLGKRQDHYIRDEVKPEDLRKNRRILEDILEWIFSNCVIEPCWASLKINMKDKKELDEIIGVSFVDSALVASQSEYVLYAEDAYLRTCVQNEPFFLTNSVWTQVVLLWLLAYGFINYQKYSEAVNIIYNQLNYGEVIFSPNTIASVAEQLGWNPNEDFSNFIQVLDADMNAEEYALVVAAGFLRCVATRNISQNEMNAFVDVVVRNLATKRNVERIAAKLISILNESETDEIGFIVDRVKNCNKSD